MKLSARSDGLHFGDVRDGEHAVHMGCSYDAFYAGPDIDEIDLSWTDELDLAMSISTTTRGIDKKRRSSVRKYM